MYLFLISMLRPDYEERVDTGSIYQVGIFTEGIPITLKDDTEHF